MVLLLIRRGLTKLNNQLRKVIKLLPECEEWDKDSMECVQGEGQQKHGHHHGEGEGGQGEGLQED
jgi:hypothetical protein